MKIDKTNNTEYKKNQLYKLKFFIRKISTSKK